MPSTIEIVANNTDKILGELDEAIERALEAVGLQAEGYAKLNLEGHIDTGLLRNSITHAIGGKSAAIGAYSADNPKPGKKNSGTYSGAAPGKNDTVFIGTNVEYAPYVELGHSLPSGGSVAGVHYLKRAVADHKEEYKKLIEAALTGF